MWSPYWSDYYLPSLTAILCGKNIIESHTYYSASQCFFSIEDTQLVFLHKFCRIFFTTFILSIQCLQHHRCRFVRGQYYYNTSQKQQSIYKQRGNTLIHQQIIILFVTCDQINQTAQRVRVCACVKLNSIWRIKGKPCLLFCVLIYYSNFLIL